MKLTTTLFSLVCAWVTSAEPYVPSLRHTLSNYQQDPTCTVRLIKPHFPAHHSLTSISVDTPTIIQTYIVNPRSAPCLQAQGNYDGAPVIIGYCDQYRGANEEWTVVAGGAAEGTGDPGPVTQFRIYGDKCLDVPDGAVYDGNKLQIWTCYDGNANQLWQWGDGGVVWVGHSKYVVSRVVEM